MDRGATEYAHSDHSSVATYTPNPDPRSANISSNNTPQSDYGLPPSSARSSGFPAEHLARYGQYPHPHHHPGVVGTMAQPTNPSISQASPTYPPYSPYPQGHDMSQYPGHPPPQGGMYGRPPDWPPYGHQGMPGPYSHPGQPQPPPQQNPQQRSGQVYSFVPIPGAQQHKRPRRRYEEIERMYKCGWNGCEKAYGTLNHLNAHVTMQSHGQKRTPEEFKEIRKEWKARKKEEENARKQEEERVRVAAQQNSEGQPTDGQQVQGQSYQPNGRPSLPPIGYNPNEQHAQGQYAHQPGGMVYQQGNGQVNYPANYSQAPYQQGQVYQQPTPSHY